MKKICSFLLIATLLNSCNDDYDKNYVYTPTPISQLPPETQIGANTFGCLLDGEVFKPGLTGNSLDCVYELVDGQYYFTLQGNRRDFNNNPTLIGLLTKAKYIEQNNTYQLLENTNGNVSGTYSYNAIF